MLNEKDITRVAAVGWFRKNVNFYPKEWFERTMLRCSGPWYEIVLTDSGELDELNWNEYKTGLPIGGNMFHFYDDSAAKKWFDENDGIQTLLSLGFRVYRNEEFGCAFGIDEVVRDSFEKYWIPLYEAICSEAKDNEEIVEIDEKLAEAIDMYESFEELVHEISVDQPMSKKERESYLTGRMLENFDADIVNRVTIIMIRLRRF